MKKKLTKRCFKCGKRKKLHLFKKQKCNKDGLGPCKKCHNKESRKYKRKNVKKLSKQSVEYYHKSEKRRKWHKKYMRRYRKINKKKLLRQGKEYHNKRIKEDIQYKLLNNLRKRLSAVIRNKWKSGSAIKDLGCSVEDLKWWLEFWWEDGMNWDNYGKKKGQWSIDHIKPLSKFDLTDRNQLLEVCNYRNLQPLWHIDNMRKGNKIR